ncbi:uncharacterized protein B0T15DRAFT_549162 [Chaetomium strumarium]|uniref:Uncharacterized protein n=1 Tax=Chaetomium strumarium TaxID=1170767 RepID=A0AAJ0M7C8_9PEZI|nr:hypothetical protein B0T15DRAFT_549162 [Chaetomium strumarium]
MDRQSSGSLQETNLGDPHNANDRVDSVRDLAKHVSPENIEKMLDSLSPSVPADSGAAKKEITTAIFRRLLATEPTAALRRLVHDDAALVPDPTERQYVLLFLDHNIDWDIAATPVAQVAQKPAAFEGILAEHHQRVTEHLQRLQLLNSKTSTPEAVSALAAVDMAGPADFARMSLTSFQEATKFVLSSEVAAETHSNGVGAAMQYQHMLVSMMQAARGTGLQGIDGPTQVKERFPMMQEAASTRGLNINLETLFGSNDMCECDDCTTVYSPASYYTSVNTAGKASSIRGTILEKLFRRRPDLGHIQLTCENTNVVLPPSRASQKDTIQAFNVGTKTTTEELLTQPQNTNPEAYRVLASAVYPSSKLPYDAPMDSIPLRRKSHDIESTLDRAVAAESLGLTQEEYVILTKEAFSPRGQSVSLDQYQKEIGVQPVHAHYGYPSEAALLDDDRNRRTGLMFVKAQFVPRTQIEYATLVDVVQTKFVNPWWPDGSDLQIMESLRHSYRFLQGLVDTERTGNARYSEVVADLSNSQLLLDKTVPNWQDDVLGGGGGGGWFGRNFDRLGELIVLDASQGPQLEGYGEIWVLFTGLGWADSERVGTLHPDVSITDTSGNMTGQVRDDGRAMTVGTPRPWPQQIPTNSDPNDPFNLKELSKISIAYPYGGMEAAPLDHLLAFWGQIPTVGDDSVYSQLFFRFDLLSYEETSEIFDPDAKGRYFSGERSKSLTAHLPVVMAALGMTAEDIQSPQFAELNDTLNLESLSFLYRHNLLAGVLDIPARDVGGFIRVFEPITGSPWTSAVSAVGMVEAWNTLQKSGFGYRHLRLPGPPCSAAMLELVDGLRAIEAAHPDIGADNPKSVETLYLKPWQQ